MTMTKSTLSLATFVCLLNCSTILAKELADSNSSLKIARLQIHFQEAKEAATNETLRLRGKDAQQQLLVTAQLDGGALRDLTHEVAFSASPTNIARVDKAGRVTPLADGSATITAATADGQSATLPVVVEESQRISPVNFPNQITPIFTKLGCNGGGCHGKSSGQNGFKLSLLGFEPTEDYEHLVKEARGRRLFPAAPEHSLLLEKGAGTLPHGGGKRLDTDSDDYKLLVRWIRQGMPYGTTNDPVVTCIEVFPKERTMVRDGEQQLVVTAHYSDGSTADVTRGALFEPNDKEMAKTDANGRVKVFEQPGDVAVMVRYQAKVAVFRATVPLGAPVENLPIAKNFIDELVFKKLKAIGLPPSPLSDDATFLRRVTIDVAGRLPTPEEAEKFLADKESTKRDRLIDRLLASGEYADYFANTWSSLLRNKRGDATHTRGTYAFHDWIRDAMFTNKPYDQFVRDVLGASGDIAQNPPVAWYRQVKNPTAQMEDTAQLFLGLRLQCAQCHHHPFEKWSQQDYYSFSAFFSQVGRKAGSQPGEETIFHKRGVATATNKKTKQPVKPAGLGAEPAQIAADDDPRQVLADWLTDKKNPFFAKALVNRYWKHFFNRGLVDPEDDMRETNPATNPELLDTLAKNFVESGYDLKNLVRTICRSQVYQLSSVPNEFNKIDRQNFSRYYPKRLTAEVLFDAINQVTKAESKFDGLPAGARAVSLPDNSFNAGSYFLTVFGRPESSSSCECERSQDASLAQSLHLLNSKDIQEKLANDSGRAALLANDSQRPDDQKIRELYEWVYSREPAPDELQFATSYLGKQLQKVGDEKQKQSAKRQAYEDTVWALLSTKEFLFNH
ncbi:MAG: DUF1553 domain-containing protein [Verrucomicrobia bacterium]|nr:DUF1553 domain-containing protein [Verrucomicrobiota bacterium]